MQYNTYIIIVTYNAMPWLDKCLGSIDFSKYKAVVIDNNSKDETVKYIETNFSEVILFDEKENLGFGKANNMGLKIAVDNNADYVFLLNQDAWVQEDTLEKLIGAHKKSTGYGILSPVHLNPKNGSLDSRFNRYINGLESTNLIKDLLSNNLNEIYGVDFVNAASWLLPIKTLKKVGVFEPLFFMYGEDNNYVQRVKYYGLKIGIVPNSHIYHDRDDEQSKIMSNDKYINRKRSTYYILLLNPNKSFYKSYLVANTYLLSKLIKMLLLFRLKRVMGLIKIFDGFKRPHKIYNSY